MKLKDRAIQIKTDIPALILAIKDKETPILAKILVGIIVIYALSPVDLIPDFIPVLGYLDDLIILPFLIVITIKLIPSKVLDRCREEAKSLTKTKKKWFFAIPFLLIWIVILFIVFRIIFAYVN